MWNVLAREVELKPLFKGTWANARRKCDDTNSYAHVDTQSGIVQSRLEHTTTGGFGPRKSEKCGSVKKRGNTQSRRQAEMFTSPPVIWSDAIMQEPRLFSRRKERGEQTDRDFRMPPKPLGASVFFWIPRAVQRSGHVYDHDFPCSATVRDQRLGSVSSLTRFSRFSAWPWWETYESTLCAFFERLGAWLTPPSQMALCRAATAATDSHRWTTQEGKWHRLLSGEPLLAVSDLELVTWDSQKD